MEWLIFALITTITAIYIALAAKKSNPFINNNNLQLLLLRHRLLVAELQEANHSLQHKIIEESTYMEIHDACSEELTQITKKIKIIDNNCNHKS